MLVQFRVKNFTSFKDEACLSMIANSGKENDNNYVNIGKDNILKYASIYGANASGKTNLIKAFATSIRIIRESFNYTPNSKLILIDPFAFSNKCKNEPCEFEYIFIKDNIRYIYGFSATIDKIVDEYLIAYYSAKPTEIFSRKDTNNFKLISEDEKELKNYIGLALDNKLFFSILGNTKYAKVQRPFEWFIEQIDTFGSTNDLTLSIMNYAFNCYENDKDGKLKEFSLALLNSADILIEDYIFEAKEMPINPIFAAPDMPKNKQVKINMKHTIKEDGENESGYLDFFRSESSGTKILFMLAPLLKYAFENGKVLYIDEFENGLHPYLLNAIIKMFNNSKINKANAQLIINTHDTNLLSLNVFRRDQIWFVEKNPNTGSSELYSLADFSVRKEENIQKGYLNGRYGAVPYITFGDEFVWKKEN